MESGVYVVLVPIKTCCKYLKYLTCSMFNGASETVDRMCQIL